MFKAYNANRVLIPQKYFALVEHHGQPKEITVMTWHNAACAQNSTINDVKKHHLKFFVKNSGFAADLKTEMLRKEYD